MAMPNPLDDVGLNNFRSSNIVVINNNYNHHQLHIHFPAQETRPAAAASSTFMIRHGIFAFTIPTAMSLVQIRYPNQNLFSLELLFRTVNGAPHDDERPRNWSLASGPVSLALLFGASVFSTLLLGLALSAFVFFAGHAAGFCPETG
ncbi:hypothetical protein L3X38_013155 [Prunus dulcis]|uniref:Uncharacterized protein n=1 Tax=Prunus dulcis TaxID=3755 RepID=A0AAD4ZHA7_PRUDU|nr:hypothetical protein L3X38_013155 [Prunus dulcis]